MAVLEKVLPKPNKLRKFLVIGLIALFTLGFIGVVGVSTYVGNNLTKPERKEITQFPEHFGLIHEDVSFVSSKDQLRLSGW